MTKAELVEEVARAAELTKKDSEVIVEEVFKNIIQALNRGEKIELRGFGSFRVRQRDARRGRNPKTGAPVDIPAKRVPYFKPGKELKELINAQGEGDGFEVDGFDDDDDDDVAEAESASMAAEAAAES
jgi:integration host factor subunit beta